MLKTPTPAQQHLERVTLEMLVPARHAIITDTHVTAGNVHDSQPYLARLDRQRDVLGFDVEAVGLDAGTATHRRLISSALPPIRSCRKHLAHGEGFGPEAEHADNNSGL